jgi:two-component system response regulator AtoC
MKILIVDDEAMQRNMLKDFLIKQGYEVTAAADGGEAMRRFSELPFQLVLLDHRMPDITGDRLLAEMKQVNPLVHAVMITAYGNVDTAVQVMKLGADDFLEKPVDLAALLEKIQQIEQRFLAEEDAAGISEELDGGELPIQFIGSDPAMVEVLSVVRRLAPTPWTVLVRGETGTGKELVARLIHLLSSYREGPFIEVNCGAIPENLFESELFGHEKGAFTGATARRKGRLEMAEGGTLFLDEIGELPLQLQPKLLRALQEKRFTTVGGGRSIAVNLRVVAATNLDLRARVSEGRFREDLFYRLNVLDVELPPLRQRKGDIPDLVAFFLERYGLHPVQFDAEAMTTLVKYTFPGNVRELEHIVQRTVTLARGNVITVADLPTEVRFHRATIHGSLSERLKAVEKEMLVAALEKAGGIQTRAAELLGISERVLRYKMGKHELKRRGP